MLALKTSAQSIKIIASYKKITLMYYSNLHAWWSTKSPSAISLSSLIAFRRFGPQTRWWFQFKTSLQMRWMGSDAKSVVGHTGVKQLGFFCSGIQLSVLLSPYLCFISFLTWFIFTRRWFMNKSEIFHANQTSMCIDLHQNLLWS